MLISLQGHLSKALRFRSVCSEICHHPGAESVWIVSDI
jgi:hypothetical protein